MSDKLKDIAKLKALEDCAEWNERMHDLYSAILDKYTDQEKVELLIAVRGVNK